MKTFVALVTIQAECEDDFLEQLEALDCYELEWWKEVNENEPSINSRLDYIQKVAKQRCAR